MNGVGNRSSSSTSSVVKKFSCKYCGKKFSQCTNATRHERSHTGEKPYLCRVCSRPFSQSHNRNRHENTIHGFQRPAQALKTQQRRVSFGKSTEILINSTAYQDDKFSDHVENNVCVSTLSGKGPKPISTKKELVPVGKDGSVNHNIFTLHVSDSSLNMTRKKPTPPQRQHHPSKRMPVTESISCPAYFKCTYCRAKFKDMAHAKGHSAMCYKRFRIEKPSPVNFQFQTFPGFRNVKTDRFSSLLASPLASRNTRIPSLSKQEYGKHGISPQRVVNSKKNSSPVCHHKCQYCSYRSQQLRHVKIHENIHTGAKPFKCRHCNFQTGNPGRLSDHRRASPSCGIRANT